MGMVGNRVIETQNENLPILDLSGCQPTQVSSHILRDNLDAGYQAADYLYSLGVTFRFVGPNHIPASRDRYLGAKNL